MGKFSKIAMGLNVIAVVAVLVALIVNVLSYGEGTVTVSILSFSYEVSYGAASVTSDTGK